MPTNTLDGTLTAIRSITRDYFLKDIVDSVYTSNSLLMKLKGNMESIDGGDFIRVPVQYARFSARNWYQGDESLPINNNDKIFNLIFQWKQANISISISGLNRLKNSGSAKVIDHLKSEVDIAKRDMADLFGTGLYSAGTDPKSISGARTYLSTSNTYGGVSQSTESWLQAKGDTTSTTLSLSLMQARYEAASEPPIRPNFCTTTETLFNAYMNLLTPVQRFSDSKMADAGFQNVLYRGMPVVEDSYVPSSYLIMHNLDYFNIYAHSQRPFPGEFIDWELPTNQDVMTSHFLFMGEAICKAPRYQGFFSALTG